LIHLDASRDILIYDETYWDEHIVADIICHIDMWDVEGGERSNSEFELGSAA
jgi:hypothetical protein